MSFWYLGTPYSKYHLGQEEAFREASRQSALLILAGVPIFCPIAHTHPIAIHGNIDPLDHKIWLPADAALMTAAVGMIVCQLAGWEDSYGVRVEIEAFRKAGKPIVYMMPGVVPPMPPVTYTPDDEYAHAFV